jgi:hypothetical protein
VTPEARVAARRAVESRYDVSGFRELRASYDPKGVLGNDMIEGLMGDPARVEKRDAFSRAFWGPLEAYAEERARETAQDDESPGQKAEAENRLVPPAARARLQPRGGGGVRVERVRAGGLGGRDARRAGVPKRAPRARGGGRAAR